MTNILFATDRQAEHLEQARALCGVKAFHADAVALAVYQDQGSKRELIAIAVFHGDRAGNADMEIGIPDGQKLSLAAAKGLAAAAFHPKYLNKRALEAWVKAEDRDTQVVLLQAGFSFAAVVPRLFDGQFFTAVMTLGRGTFEVMEAANAAD